MEELVARFKAGDESVFDEIVNTHIPLVKHLARRWMQKYPSKWEDIYSSAMLGLVQAIRWAPERLKDCNISPYIVVTVTRFIRDFLRTDYIIPVPRTLFKKRMLADENPVPIVFSRTKDELDSLTLFAVSKDEKTLDEVIEGLDFTEKQKQIINLRMQGYSLREIGEYFGVTRMQASHEVKKIRDAYVCRSKETD